MSRHHHPFTVQEASFFAALVPIVWLFVMVLAGRFLDRLHRRRKPAHRRLLPAPE